MARVLGRRAIRHHTSTSLPSLAASTTRPAAPTGPAPGHKVRGPCFGTVSPAHEIRCGHVCVPYRTVRRRWAVLRDTGQRCAAKVCVSMLICVRWRVDHALTDMDCFSPSETQSRIMTKSCRTDGCLLCKTGPSTALSEISAWAVSDSIRSRHGHWDRHGTGPLQISREHCRIKHESSIIGILLPALEGPELRSRTAGELASVTQLWELVGGLPMRVWQKVRACQKDGRGYSGQSPVGLRRERKLQRT
ncbi:hypothetical protein M432DRAFT_203408 [Thermoascus aurantiacus ATCC 26904]